MRSIIVIIVIIFTLASGYFLFLGIKAKDNDPIPVDFIQVTKGPFVSSVSTTGKIISRKVEIIKSTMYGIIFDAGYQNRDFVKKGAIIAKIRLVEQELARKQQQLKLAEIDLEILQEQRQLAEELLQAKAISERELKEIKIREYKQQVYVNDIKKELVDEPVIASFDGMIVNKKFVHLSRVFNGTELFTLIDPDDIYVELPVFQKDVPRVRIGQPVNYTSTIFNAPRHGKVLEISPIASLSNTQTGHRQTGLATFNIYSSINLLPDDLLLFDSNVDALIVLGRKEDIISVPLESVLYFENRKIVYIVENDQAKSKIVKTGEYDENEIEVLAGLIEGDKVITRGNLDVKDGSFVSPGRSIREEKNRVESSNRRTMLPGIR